MNIDTYKVKFILEFSQAYPIPGIVFDGIEEHEEIVLANSDRAARKSIKSIVYDKIGRNKSRLKRFEIQEVIKWVD